MILRSFVKINLLFRIMDPLKRKSPFFIFQDGNVEHLEKEKDSTSSVELNISPLTETKETQDTGTDNFV